LAFVCYRLTELLLPSLRGITLCTLADRRSLEFVGQFNMALRGRYHRNTTSLYLIESREAERKLAEARKKKKVRASKASKTR